MTTRIEASASGLQLHMLRHHDLTEEEANGLEDHLALMHSEEHRYNPEMWDHLKGGSINANAE